MDKLNKKFDHNSKAQTYLKVHPRYTLHTYFHSIHIFQLNIYITPLDNYSINDIFISYMIIVLLNLKDMDMRNIYPHYLINYIYIWAQQI